MGKKLAIQGHPTRGKEVIELLEMMGGVNGKINKKTGETYNIYNGRNFIDEICDVREVAYYIDFESQIRCIDIKDITTHFIVYSIGMFLDQFPYKVGDKVHIYIQNDDIDGRYDIEVEEITSMRWNPARCKIAYKMKNINREFYKEEIKCKVDVDHTETSKMKNVIAELLEHIKTTPKEELEKEFKEIEEWSNVGPTVEEFMTFCESVNKKPKYKYPTTYKECCDVLSIPPYYNLRYHTYEHGYTEYAATYELCSLQDKLNTLGKLLICRAAYWKIYGEQMGLDKPWKPDWSNDDETKFCIYTTQNMISLDMFGVDNRILAFPTEELQDIFYNNFRDLIEQTKELL